MRRVAAALVLVLAAAACSDDAPPPEGGAPTTTEVAPDPSDDAGEGVDGVARTVPVQGRPAAVAHWPATGLWVVDDAAGTEPSRIELASADTGGVAAELAGLPAPAPVAVVAVDDGAWVIGATGTLARVGHPEGGEPTLSTWAQVELGGALVDATVVGDRLYVGDIERSVVHVLDADSGAVLAPPVTVPAGVVRLAAAGDRLWVSGLESEVTPLVLAAKALAAGAPVPVGAGPIGLAVVDGVLWVANGDDDTVSRLDPVSGAPVGDPVAVGDAPIAVAGRDGVVWVLDQDGRTVTRLHGDTGEHLGPPVPLPMRPRGMALAGAIGAWVVGVDPSLAVLVTPP